MFRKSCVALLGLCLVCAVRAANVYVVPPGTPGVVPDGAYQTWETAATNIQDAIDAIDTASGNVIYITNGTYLLPDQLNVNKDVVLRSYKNGMTSPSDTILDGNNYEGKPVTNRVVQMDHAEAVLDGLTMTGGFDHRGAGIDILKSFLITNCIVINNEATTGGGGLYTISAGLMGTVTHSVIASNIASQGGGCYILAQQGNRGLLEHCEIIWNEATDNTAANGGGGIRAGYLGTAIPIRNCLIAHNTVRGNGGGVNLWYSGLMENCVIVSNIQTSASSTRDGSALYLYTPEETIIRNCLIANNTAAANRAAIRQTNKDGSLATLRIENCALVENEPYGLILERSITFNTVIYGNQAGEAALLNDDTIFNNCLSSIALPGTANLVGDPLFIDTDFRLAPHSPGINAGMELEWMLEPDARDLDGQRRIDRVFKQVDIGCYEFLPQITFFRLH